VMNVPLRAAAVPRAQAEPAAEAKTGTADPGIDYLDIPAFLRRQAD